jgi:hypothetical protein
MNRVLALLPKQVQFALILMLIVVLTQLLGQAGTTLVDWAWKGGREVSVIDGVVEFLVAAVCVGVTYWMGQAWSRPPGWVAGIRAGVAAVAVVSSNTFLNTAGAIVGGLVGESVFRWLLLLVLLMALWGWAALVCMPRIQKWFQAQVDRGITEEANYGPGHVVLVLFVSAISDESLDVDSGTACGQHLSFVSLEADIKALKDSGWRWQHLMRGVQRALQRNQPDDRTTIVLVGSAGADGSFRQLERCIAFLKRYPELADADRADAVTSSAYLRQQAPQAGLPVIPVDIAEGGIDFENFNVVRRHVLLVVHVAAHEVGASRVYVDVTGGQKTTSIAAAVATTGEIGFCQYVQTRWPHKVRIYDLHPPELPAI